MRFALGRLAGPFLPFVCFVFFASAAGAQTWPPRLISRTVDVTRISTIDAVEFFSGEQVVYQIRGNTGSATNPAALPTNGVAIWYATDDTFTNYFIVWTNSAQSNATGFLEFVLPTPYSALTAKTYESWVNVYGGTPTNGSTPIGVFDRLQLKVKQNASYAGTYRGPITYTNVTLDGNTYVAQGFWALHQNDINSVITGLAASASAGTTAAFFNVYATNLSFDPGTNLLSQWVTVPLPGTGAVFGFSVTNGAAYCQTPGIYSVDAFGELLTGGNPGEYSWALFVNDAIVADAAFLGNPPPSYKDIKLGSLVTLTNGAILSTKLRVVDGDPNPTHALTFARTVLRAVCTVSALASNVTVNISGGSGSSTNVSFENLDNNGDVGTGSNQVARGSAVTDETTARTAAVAAVRNELGAASNALTTAVGTKIGASGVTFENADANGDIGTGSNQFARGNAVGGGSGDFMADGSVPMTGPLAMHTGVLNLGTNAYAFGDSMMDGAACGVPVASNIWNYITNNKGWFVTNLAVSGGEIADFIPRVYATTIRAADSSFALLGYNDMRHRGESVQDVADFKAGALSMCAWLSIPQASIVLGQSASVTNVGTWTNSTHYGGAMGKASSTESNGVYFRMRGPTIYVNLLMAGRGMQVLVDGTNVGTFATGTYTAANSGTNCLPQLIRIGGLASGWHDISLKVAAGSGQAHFLWAASPRASLVEQAPSLFLGNCLDMTTSGYATGGDEWDNGSDVAVSRYNDALSDVARILAGDGLNVAYVDVNARWVASTMVCGGDQVHPNEVGYAVIGEAFLTEMNSASRFTGRGLDPAGFLRVDRLQVGNGRDVTSLEDIATLSNCMPIAVWNWINCSNYTNAQNVRWASSFKYPVLLESLRATVTGSGTGTVSLISRQDGTGAWTTQAVINAVGFTNIDLSSITIAKTNSIGLNLTGGANADNLNVVLDGWISVGAGIDLSDPYVPPPPPSTGTYYGAAMNKTNSSFATASAADLGITNAFTFCAWVSLADSGGYDYNLFQLGQGFSPAGPSCVKLVANATVPGGTYIYWTDSSSVARKNYTYPALGTSTQLHVALTYDGSNIVLYTNGAVCAPSSTPLDNACVLANDTRKAFIGCGSNNDGASIIDRLQGVIYSSAFFPRALAATAITAIVSGKCTTPEGSPNHVYNTYSAGSAYEDAIGSVDLVATNITAVTNILTECP